MPVLSYVQRKVNGHGLATWRSFHFAVAGTNWIVVVHDQGSGREPWTIFINRSMAYSFQGRFADFQQFVAQLPEPLQNELRANEALFPSPRHSRTSEVS